MSGIAASPVAREIQYNPSIHQSVVALANETNGEDRDEPMPRQALRIVSRTDGSGGFSETRS